MDGDTITAMNHRLGKAEGKFAEFREVLCSRAGSLKKIFEEYVKRVVPVFLHGCGAWSWSQEIRRKVHGVEGRWLASIMMPGRKPEEDDKTFFTRRLQIARQRFKEMGFLSLVHRCLRHFFRFGAKVAPSTSQPNSSESIVISGALSWRNKNWWDSEEWPLLLI